MTRVLLVSVSTPAVKQAVEYARRMRDKDVDFRIHYICGTIGSSMADAGRLRGDVAGADLIVLDLMGADGRFMMAAAPALKSSPAQRIVIGRMVPVSSRLGGFDPEAS
jgi:phosphoribosylpyrophosphate synthetase